MNTKPHTIAQDDLVEQLVSQLKHGTDEKFGARPLRRAIEHHLEDALSEAMLRGDFEGKNMVEVTIKPVEEALDRLPEPDRSRVRAQRQRAAGS